MAATESGENFVNDFSDLLGLDVAASDDLTGHTGLSGDWNFEYRVGEVENAVAFTIELQANWVGELEIAAASSSDGSAGSLAVSDNGDIVRVFSSDQPAGSDGLDVYSVWSEQTQTSFSAEIRVNETTTGTQEHASVAIADNGDRVFVWTSDHSGDRGIYAKIVAADGSTIKNEFEVDQGNGADNASVAMDGNGNFVIAWESTELSDPDGGIFVQFFDGSGSTVDATLLVNQTTAGIQGNPDVLINNNNEFIVAWDTLDVPGQEAEIFVRKYVVDPAQERLPTQPMK